MLRILSLPHHAAAPLATSAAATHQYHDTLRRRAGTARPLSASRRSSALNRTPSGSGSRSKAAPIRRSNVSSADAIAFIVSLPTYSQLLQCLGALPPYRSFRHRQRLGGFLERQAYPITKQQQVLLGLGQG